MNNRLLIALITTLFATTATAHTWLTQSTVDRMLDRITSAAEQVAAGGQKPDPSALYELADASSGLATLMNEEFAAHGAERRDLLLSSIERAEAAGVNILWSGSHNRFFYDGDAYRRFIRIAEKGEKDAEARYYLIETDFYLGNTEKKSALLGRIAEKSEFLELYPGFRERYRIKLFLGIDHRDLWRLCLEMGEKDCAETHADSASAHFRAVVDQNPDAEIGEVGARLLARLDAERNVLSD